MIVIRDVRLRLASAFVVIVAVSQLDRILLAGISLAAAVALALFARMPRQMWQRLFHLEAFVILLFLTLPFAVSGQPLFTIGPLTASLDGVMRAVLIGFKVSTAVLILVVLLGSIEPTRIGAALYALKFPDAIVRLFVMTVRYMSLLRDEARRLHDAMRARAFAPRSNRHTWRSYGYLIGMLLVRALERAERVEEAMACRGYTGRFPHPALAAPTMTDWIGFMLLSSLSVLLLIVDYL